MCVSNKLFEVRLHRENNVCISGLFAWKLCRGTSRYCLIIPILKTEWRKLQRRILFIAAFLSEYEKTRFFSKQSRVPLYSFWKQTTNTEYCFMWTLTDVVLHQNIMKDRWINMGMEENELKPYKEPPKDILDTKRIGKHTQSWFTFLQCICSAVVCCFFNRLEYLCLTFGVCDLHCLVSWF